MKRVRSANSKGTDYNALVPVVTAKGTSKWLEIKTHVIRSGGKPKKRFSLAKDVTEAKLQEASFKLLFDHNPCQCGCSTARRCSS